MSALQPTPVPDVYLLDAGLKGVPGYTGVYLIDAERPAVVETGFSYSVPRILAGLELLGIKPEAVRYVFPTHVHLDHAGGAGGLARACEEAEVVVHHKGAKHLIDPARLVESVKRAVGKLFERYGEAVPIPQERIRAVEGGERFPLGPDFSLELVDAPGHAPHQYCAFVPEHRALFTADAAGIFRQEIGELVTTTPPPAFRLGQSLETLNELRALEPKTLLFTHFGPQERPELLDDYAELLTGWVSEVEETYDTMQDEAAVKHHFVEKLSPELEAHYDDEVMVKQEIEMNVQGVLLYLQRQRGG